MLTLREPPRVTVVIPALNAEGTLGRALDSIIAQSFTNWEAVVADDVSTDGTWVVIQNYVRRYPDRVRSVRRATNGGPAAARNSALGASSATELIALLDADDYWLPDYLERQIGVYDAAANAGRRPGIVCCNAYLEKPNGGRVCTFDEVNGWCDPIRYADMIDRSRIFVSSLFPRAVLDEVGHFETDCWGSEDYDLWLRILEAGYEAVPNFELLAVYQLTPGSVSASPVRRAEAAVVALERALNRSAPTSKQKRAIRREIRYKRAVREHALVRQARGGGESRRRAVLRLLPLLPGWCMVAAERPSRWLGLLTKLVGAPSRIQLRDA